MKLPMRWLVPLLALLVPLSAAAQKGLEFDIVGGNAAATPIAVVPMSQPSTLQTDIAKIVASDLNRSGAFRSLPVEAMPAQRPARHSEIEIDKWRAANQDYMLVGRVLDAGANIVRMEYELVDVAKNERLFGYAMSGHVGTARQLAHQIADQVYEKITGVRGAFDTRIAYVKMIGSGKSAQYQLIVADSDNFNPVAVVKDGFPILSPSWHPDGKRIAFVSYNSGQSAVYIIDITRDTALPAPIAKFRGINGAPSFSPDGRKLALTLSKTGNPEIYVMDLASRALTQITNHFAIDTSAVWSGDGSSLYFVSDRGGQPQIYQVSASGGGASRVTFQGSYNADPSITADGKKLAVTQGGGSYRIALNDRGLGGTWTTLSPGRLDESPSFAPNGMMILYAARDGGRDVLFAVSADGRVRQRLAPADGNVREPAWGPFRTAR